MQDDKRIIKEYGLSQGAIMVGIAPVERFEQAPKGYHPINLLPDCKSIIVLAFLFPKESLFTSPIEYTAIRNKLVKKSNQAAKELARNILEQGYSTKVVNSIGGSWKQGRFRSPLSLKHAGELAGLGKINQNYLLTNDKYGNLLWLSGVLTSLALSPDPLAEYILCDKCKKCITHCPSVALEPKEFDQKACYKVCYKTIKGKLELKCWQCRKVCPYHSGISN